MVYFLKSFINIDDFVSIFDKHSEIPYAHYVDGYAPIGHFLDIRRNPLTVVNAVENHRKVQIEAMFTASWKTPTLVAPSPRSRQRFTSMLHLLTEGCTDGDSQHHHQRYHWHRGVASIQVGDVHRTTFSFTGSSVFSKFQPSFQ